MDMYRVLVCGFLFLSLATVGCSREGEVNRTDAAREADADEAIEVTGCLTANRDTNQFVLTADRTALTSATGIGTAETYTYQLVGGTNLHEHVGQQVTVKGSLEGKSKEVEFESERKTEQPQVQSRGEEVTPAVESEENIALRVQRLHVASVTPTGSGCRVGSPQ